MRSVGAAQPIARPAHVGDEIGSCIFQGPLQTADRITARPSAGGSLSYLPSRCSPMECSIECNDAFVQPSPKTDQVSTPNGSVAKRLFKRRGSHPSATGRWTLRRRSVGLAGGTCLHFNDVSHQRTLTHSNPLQRSRRTDSRLAFPSVALRSSECSDLCEGHHIMGPRQCKRTSSYAKLSI